MFIRTRNNILYNVSLCSRITKARIGDLFEIWVYIDGQHEPVFTTVSKVERDEAYNILCEGIAKGASMIDFYIEEKE